LTVTVIAAIADLDTVGAVVLNDTNLVVAAVPATTAAIHLHRLALAAIVLLRLSLALAARLFLVALDEFLAFHPLRGPHSMVVASTMARALDLLTAAALLGFLLTLAMFLSTAVTALLGSNGSSDRQRGSAGG
jgi:hypothetical protein